MGFQRCRVVFQRVENVHNRQACHDTPCFFFGNHDIDHVGCGGVCGGGERRLFRSSVPTCWCLSGRPTTSCGCSNIVVSRFDTGHVAHCLRYHHGSASSTKRSHHHQPFIVHGLETRVPGRVGAWHV